MYRDPVLGHLVPPRAAEASIWFMKASSHRAECLLNAIDKNWFRSFVFWMDRMTVPGILLHYVLRKRYLEEVARLSLGAGFQQVVVLGAGFYTLALRLHEEFAEGFFIETDHPATQRVKKQALERRGLPRHNMRFLAVDLSRQGLDESLLTGQGYAPDGDTLFVAEGLLMYLKPDEVDRLFRFISSQRGRRVRFAFTFMEPQANGKVNFETSRKAVDWWLWLRREPFQWGIRREHLPQYLETNGCSLREVVTPEALRRRYLTGGQPVYTPSTNGDLVCVADRS
jgi:methyltransferase (TIGR00027 family)